MLLFSIGFKTLTFKFLEVSTARLLIRKTFPFFYFYVFIVALVASPILVVTNLMYFY